MDNFERWSEQLQETSERLGEVYESLAMLQRELKEAGHKKDAAALSEPVERLARYGRLLQEMRQAWSARDD